MPGVYGLSNAREWVFVAVADDIRAALMGHLQEGNTTLKSRAPTGFTFEVCHPSQGSARVSRLVAELSPVCNKGVGQNPGVHGPLG